jgi:hypothetical protein
VCGFNNTSERMKEEKQLSTCNAVLPTLCTIIVFQASPINMENRTIKGLRVFKFPCAWAMTFEL